MPQFTRLNINSKTLGSLSIDFKDSLRDNLLDLTTQLTIYDLPRSKFKFRIAQGTDRLAQLRRGDHLSIVSIDDGKESLIFKGVITKLQLEKTENSTVIIGNAASEFVKFMDVIVNTSQISFSKGLRAVLEEFRRLAGITSSITVHSEVPDEIYVLDVNRMTLMSVLIHLSIHNFLCIDFRNGADLSVRTRLGYAKQLESQEGMKVNSADIIKSSFEL